MQIPTPGGPSNYQPEGLGWDLSRRNGIIRKSKNEFFVICYREHCPWYGSILMINVGDNIIKSNGKDLSRFICYSQLAETQQWNSTREKCDRAELISVSAQNSSPNVLKKN